MKARTKKDWVTTVLEDLKKLDLEMNMEEIGKMKKTCFMQMIKERIQTKAFKNLEKTKHSHSKVENVEHLGIKMQKYLKPNQNKMSKDESQLIFKLRCRVTKVKENLKGIYDSLECDTCGKEEESQMHIIICEELNRNKNIQEVKCGKIFNGTVTEQTRST